MEVDEARINDYFSNAAIVAPLEAIAVPTAPVPEVDEQADDVWGAAHGAAIVRDETVPFGRFVRTNEQTKYFDASPCRDEECDRSHVFRRRTQDRFTKEVIEDLFIREIPKHFVWKQ